MTVKGSCGANATAKVSSIVAGMAAGADSIEDLDALRHGGMDKLFNGIRALSTLGSFLCALSWGNVHRSRGHLILHLPEHRPGLTRGCAPSATHGPPA